MKLLLDRSANETMWSYGIILQYMVLYYSVAL